MLQELITMLVSVIDISVTYVSTAIDSLDAPMIAIVHSCNILCPGKSSFPTGQSVC